MQAAASDLIGGVPIDHALIVSTCRTQALCDPPPCGEMVSVAADNNTSKFLRAPMLDKKNLMPMTPMAWRHTPFAEEQCGDITPALAGFSLRRRTLALTQR